MKISAAARNALADAVDDQVNGGAGTATIKIYTGAQPTNPDTAIGAQVLLATFNLSATAFGAAASGVITLAGVPLSATGAAAGTAAWFRMANKSGTAIADGTVGTAGSDINLTTTTISSGVTVELTSFTITMPLGV